MERTVEFLEERVLSTDSLNRGELSAGDPRLSGPVGA
jgi:hypothetical protein